MTNEEFIKSISLEGEEWRFIHESNNAFMVSSFGRVASMSREIKCYNASKTKTAPKLLKPQANWGGYLRIRLIARPYDKTKLVHRLVAEQFIPNPNNYPYIDHLDGNKSNNKASNLKWCTRSMNMMNPITRIRNSNARKGKTTSNARPIIQIKDGVVINTFQSVAEAANKYNLSTGTLCDCCKNQNHTYKGYNWMYLSDYEALTNKSKNAISNPN